MSGFLLRDPIWLLSILPGLLLWRIAYVRRKRHFVVYSSGALVAGLPTTMALRWKRVLPIVGSLGLLLCTLALARPQQGTEEFRVTTEGVGILVALDRSGSMEAMDFRVDGENVRRVEVAKKATQEFVAGEEGQTGRPHDLIGLVSFGGFAEAVCPPTLDHGALLQVLGDIDTPQPLFDDRGRMVNQTFLEEEAATAIGDALALSVERLRNVEAKSKVIILLSDGKNTAGVVDPLAAVVAAKEFGVKVYTIGIGSTGRAPFRLTDAFGRPTIRQQWVELDEKLLTQIAEETGGKYFNVRNTEALREVYGEIDQLEKTEIEGRVFTQYRDLYQWLLLPGLALFAMSTLLRSTRFRSLP